MATFTGTGSTLSVGSGKSGQILASDGSWRQSSPIEWSDLIYPKTTAEILAVAVLKGEPCGRQLVDCLIEEGVVDVDGEFAAKVRDDERSRFLSILNCAVVDATVAEEDGGSPEIAEMLREVISAVKYAKWPSGEVV